ncbi:hypothetical protein [Sulfurimonas sp. NW9]|uniref:hypothetical protein n=1 Tax=Sulfurimonas sp. NW9 TaxID=2922728 RepID=UPI003DA9F620
MQVKQENIKRPSLIEPFLNMELSPTNEFIKYIDCSVKSSNVVHKKNNVTSTADNSEKSLNNEEYFSEALPRYIKKRDALLLKKQKLQSSKTKYDIAYWLDICEPVREFTLLIDCFTKDELIEYKIEFLKRLENSIDTYNLLIEAASSEFPQSQKS